MMVFAPADFFTELRKRLKQSLPSELRGFRTTRGRGRLMKVYFGEPAFHYEAWHHTGAGRLEVGLHFESSAADNQAAFDFFRAPSSSRGTGAGLACTRRCRRRGLTTWCWMTRWSAWRPTSSPSSRCSTSS